MVKCRIFVLFMCLCKESLVPGLIPFFFTTGVYQEVGGQCLSLDQDIEGNCY